ncbi:MAG TPA: Fe-S cluster assembly protein SufD [Verrucomicrobiae bacterium]|nr:Fe-S cluster assembly protein SufD [Verrucomicrobiae bacterium]
MVEANTVPSARAREPVWHAFEAFEQAGHGTTPSWLQALHKGGIAHFAELGFPTTKHEEWRYTNISPIAKTEWHLPGPPAKLKEKEVHSFLFPNIPGKRLVFVDGHFSRDLSSKESSNPQALRIQSMHDAVRSTFPLVTHGLARYARYDENPFTALNTAFLHDGAVIVAPPGFVENDPVYILYLSTGAQPNTVTHPRTLLIAQRDSQMRVIEHYVTMGENTCLTNAVTEMVIDETAQIEHCKIQEESLRTYHVANIHVQQARSSHLLSHSISMGAAITRNNINCVLDGERIESTLNGLYLGRDSQLVDHHTAIFHNKPQCNSHEYYHGILDGASHGVFNGKIFVRPEAQKTDAKQTNRNLLLSDEASIDTKPQLEIFADDVKCTHGATIGQLDPESIFYLRARGISLETARKMLLHAFASQIVNRITIGPLRDELDRRLFDMFEK